MHAVTTEVPALLRGFLPQTNHPRPRENRTSTSSCLSVRRPSLALSLFLSLSRPLLDRRLLASPSVRLSSPFNVRFSKSYTISYLILFLSFLPLSSLIHLTFFFKVGGQGQQRVTTLITIRVRYCVICVHEVRCERHCSLNVLQRDASDHRKFMIRTYHPSFASLRLFFRNY